jgi:uncharacterized protein
MDRALHTFAVDSYAPMLESLAAILDKGAAHAASAKIDLVNARLAPDMFTLAQQVQQACHYAGDGVARLTGRPVPAMEEAETSVPGLKAQIGRTLDAVRAVPAAAFDGAAERDCSLSIPGDLRIEMDGLRFLRSWSLPHFYFHVVTAYDILRHCGVEIGKRDYLSQVGAFIRPQEI